MFLTCLANKSALESLISWIIWFFVSPDIFIGTKISGLNKVFFELTTGIVVVEVVATVVVASGVSGITIVSCIVFWTI